MTENFDILQLGHPLLREVAAPVAEINSPEFQAQLDAMMSFVLDKGGMGIAAPQIGIKQQFFILCSHPNQRYPYAPDVSPFFVINPSVTAYSDEMTKDWEGCLSLPGIRALVPRHKQINVRYHDRAGQLVETEYSGFLARIFQHELDHLQGKVFLDRIESTQDVMMEQPWQEYIAQHPTKV